MDFSLDLPLNAQQAAKASHLLMAAGFDTASIALCQNSPRTIAWTIGKASAQRRHTVLELIECALDSDTEAA